MSPSPRPHPRSRSRSRRRWIIAAASTTAACVTAATGVWLAAGSASAGTISGTLYREPSGTAVARWLAANPNDSRAQVIRDKIASQPASRWLSNFNLSTVQAEVSGYVSAANAVGQIPALTLYGIPNRDCGGASAGGAPDLPTYQTWVSNIAAGLGNRTVLIVLEPDSIALQTCLSAAEIAARDAALRQATTTLKAGNPNAKVYMDAGHSAWNSAADQAGRLVNSGIAVADGFYTNASNFQSTDREAAYGRSIISALQGRGVSGKTQVIDTSRNGGAAGDWCGDDNTDRRIGQYPTTATNDANIDAYLWIKPPGEADGCAFQAGSFQPSLAASLAQSAPNPPATTAPTTMPTTVPTTAPTTPPTTAPTTTPTQRPPTDPPTLGSYGCTATYQTTGSWNGGFQGQVTVTAADAAINGWTVTWTLGSGQTISQVWNGALTTTSTAATVRNVAWNGSLAARASAQFGFLANGNASTAPALLCFGS
ncbi:glycoside hydrolase family 6 protein [Paractinoplanes rishiriensis]|uniref:Glucanase n=1 Tax=Paractinoplanes rishiriensis TaxID=1050105 RepID=A0A919JVQ3_9ACTN|nr:glycoside hydrolase family 6 protein [Actinoplanes rishiriensis]GIE94182.1 glucanase [Actinoplanes rishiriensis]